MRIVFFETEVWEEALLRETLSGHALHFVHEPLRENTSLAEELYTADCISVFIYSQVTKDIIAKFPSLTLITTRSTGYDHIDMTAARERQIQVSNVPVYGIHTVAEHTWSLLLALARKLSASVERTRKGNFDVAGLAGVELFGKTLGIIGVGNIGSIVARLGLAFGMRVLAYNRSIKEDLQAAGVTFAPLETVLASSDFISLHLPFTDETKHILNASTMQTVKKGAYIVNCARGGLIDTQSLADALETGHIAGAALDVLEEECDMKEERALLSSEFLKHCDLKTVLLDHQLLMRDDVIITPHNAFHSDASVLSILRTTCDTIESFGSGVAKNVIV